VKECEEYNSKLVWAIGLELTINPDISQGKARASLERLQLSYMLNVESQALIYATAFRPIRTAARLTSSGA